MGIDMSNYMMIYKERVFNVINIMPSFEPCDREVGTRKAKMIDAATINEDGELVVINDEAWMFKFVRR